VTSQGFRRDVAAGADAASVGTADGVGWAPAASSPRPGKTRRNVRLAAAADLASGDELDYATATLGQSAAVTLHAEGRKQVYLKLSDCGVAVSAGQ
jgi:hypothetical protein